MSNINIRGDIQGDGVAIGTGNRTFVDKRITHHQHNGGGGHRSRGTENDSGNVFGIGTAVLLALAIAVWKFAQYAPQIYLTLGSTALIAFVLTVITTLALHYDQPMRWFWDQMAIGLSTVMAGLAVIMSVRDFPTELTQLALTTPNWKEFWCGLSSYGTQIATFHTLSMSLLAIPALLLAMTQALGAAARWAFFATGFNLFTRFALLQRRSLTLISLGFAALCFISQLDVGQQFWAGIYEAHINNGMHLLCPR